MRYPLRYTVVDDAAWIALACPCHTGARLLPDPMRTAVRANRAIPQLPALSACRECWHRRVCGAPRREGVTPDCGRPASTGFRFRPLLRPCIQVIQQACWPGICRAETATTPLRYVCMVAFAARDNNQESNNEDHYKGGARCSCSRVACGRSHAGRRRPPCATDWLHHARASAMSARAGIPSGFLFPARYALARRLLARPEPEAADGFPPTPLLGREPLIFAGPLIRNSANWAANSPPQGDSRLFLYRLSTL